MVLLAMSGVANAGGYVGAGVGDAPTVETDRNYEAAGRSARFLVGYRFPLKIGAASIEGAYGGYGARGSGGGEIDGRELSASGKYNYPLGSNFEVFGRIGVQKTSLTSQKDAMYDLDGNGILIGAGLEYRIDLGAASGSLWLDYTHRSAALEGERNSTDYTARMWTLGLTVGL
ncbi:MAG: outer membrane beta-barrel protein [Kofleriaceae bacterium]